MTMTSKLSDMDKTLNHFAANWRGWGLGARAGQGGSLAPGAQLGQSLGRCG